MARQTLQADDDHQPEDTDNLEAFEQQVSAGVVDALPYDRLMIAYRKRKDYENELRVIKKAIAVFEKHLHSIQSKILKGKKASNIKSLSAAFSRQTGLVDKKGNTVHVPEPIARWQNRLTVTEKKLAASKKKKIKK